MEKIKGFFMLTALYICLFVIWAITGLEVLDE